MTRPSLLMVEDAPELGVILTALGRRAGWDVACRPDVPGGWEYLQGAVPDLLLLDIRLPGLDGLVLCRRVRATPRLAALPVALFTHWGLPGDVAAGLEAGADFLVSKELVGRPPALQARLAEILAWVRGQPSGASLGWTADGRGPPPPGWEEAVNRALGHPSLRCVGGEVMHVLLRRAVRRAFAQTAPPADESTWVSPDGRSLAPQRLPPALPPGAVSALIGSLAEQLWRLLGDEASAPARAALADALGDPPGRP